MLELKRVSNSKASLDCISGASMGRRCKASWPCKHEQDHSVLSRFRVRSTNEKGFYQTFFSGSEELINLLNESRSKDVIQRELERISKRTDFKIHEVVWQAAWR